MFKICIKTFIISIFFILCGALFPVFADELDNYVNLESISFNKNNNGEIVINFKKDKPFLTQPLIFEKNKNVYLISLIATNYSGDRNVDVSNLVDDISSVTVDFISYKINTDQGYTRVIINTNSPQKFVINEDNGLFSSDIVKILYIVAGVILILVISYLAFALYMRLHKRRRIPKMDFDNYRYNSDDNVVEPTDIQEDSENSDMTKDVDSITDKDEGISFANQGSPEEIQEEVNESDISVSADEMVDDILNNGAVLDEISETIAKNDRAAELSAENDIENSPNDISEKFSELNLEDVQEEEKSLDKILGNGVEGEQIHTVDSVDSVDSVDDVGFYDEESEDILDEISYEEEQNFEEYSAAILDEAFSDDSDSYIDAEEIPETDEGKQTDEGITNNNYDINEVVSTSGGETAFSSKSFDFTSMKQDEQLTDIDSVTEQVEPETVSPFDAFGFSGVMDTEAGTDETQQIGELSAAITDEAFDIDNFDTDISILDNENEKDNHNVVSNLYNEEKEESVSIIHESDENIPYEAIPSAIDESISENDVAIGNDVEIDSADESKMNLGDDIDVNKNENMIEDIYGEEDHNLVAQTIQDNEFSDEISTDTKESFFEQNNAENFEPEIQEEVPVRNQEFNTEAFFMSDNMQEEPIQQEEVDISIKTDGFFEDKENIDDEPQDIEAFFITPKAAPNINEEEIRNDTALNTPDIITEENIDDDTEPVVLDKKDFTKMKHIYLIRHKGKYSLIATIKDNVFVIEKFANKPQKTEIILKLNESRKDDDVYIVKVGTWRALVSVSKNEVKNILTL